MTERRTDEQLERDADALREQIKALRAELNRRREAREGSGLLCLACTERLRAAGTLKPGEHRYHYGKCG